MSKLLFSRVIVAITGSDASILAAKYAIVMAKMYHCKVFAVYVVDTETLKQLVSCRIFIDEESLDYEHSLEANGDRYLSFVEELASAKGVRIERSIRKGAVHTELLAAADESNADLILLGGLEKDGNGRDIYWESHRKVFKNARCSVMLAKEPEIDQIYKQA